LNGITRSGTEADSVDFRAILAFAPSIGLTEEFDFDFQLLNTPNNGSRTQNADSVFLTSLFPTTIFAVDGIDYTLQMGFGSVKGGFSKSNKFSVLERRRASASLIGTITAVNPPPPPPSVPDTGSTLALMAMALVGVGGLRQYLTCKV
jgi:hypothetical protein